MQYPEASPRKTGPGTWSRMKEEYLADFILIAKRTLTADEYKILRFYFLLGADWKLCTRRLKLDKGNFFHAVYRIEVKLGRAFAETQPYGLYPLDEYFGRSRAGNAVPILGHPGAVSEALVLAESASCAIPTVAGDWSRTTGPGPLHGHGRVNGQYPRELAVPDICI